MPNPRWACAIHRERCSRKLLKDGGCSAVRIPIVRQSSFGVQRDGQTNAQEILRTRFHVGVAVNEMEFAVWSSSFSRL
ncbi:MAG: hypothetical protein HY242_05080 [Afipia sp.]|nr:hypothetical protein [Afipia sp.]